MTIDIMLNDFTVTITEIKKAKKHLCEIYADNEFYAFLDKDIVYQSLLKESDVLTFDKLELLKEQSDFKRAKEKALYLLDFHDFSSYEMKRKLKKDYSDEIIAKVLDKLCELSLIDDRIYAKRYMNTLIKVKGFTGKRIRLELMKKGISKDIIDDVISECEYNSPNKISEQIKAVFTSRLKYKSEITEKEKRRVVSKLLRMGYEYDDIKSVAEELEIKL